MAGLLSRYFGFGERSTDLATEVRAGFTTFMVMAYIVFVNPVILGFTGVPELDGKGAVRLPRQQQQQHDLHRVRRRRDRGRPDGPRVRGDGTPVPGRDV